MVNEIRIMIRGLSVAPWTIESRLTALGFRHDAQVKNRDDALGHIAVVKLESYRDRPIMAALNASPAARDGLVSFLRYAVGSSYQVHVLICTSDTEDVSEAVQLTPGALKLSLPQLLDHAGTLILLQSEDPRAAATGSDNF